MPRKDDLENLIRIHTDHLQKLKEQKAKFGLYAPVHLSTEIENVEAEIEKLQNELNIDHSSNVQVVESVSENEANSNQVPVNTVTQEIVLLIDRDFNAYTEDDQEHLISAIVNLLNIKKSGVTIKKIEPGSIKLTIELQSEQARKLFDAIKSGYLADLHVTDAELKEYSKSEVESKILSKKDSETQPTGKVLDLDDSNFEHEVLKANLPVIVHFYAPWAGPAQGVNLIIVDLAQQFEGQAIFARLNTDLYPDKAMQYDIQGIPTLLFFKYGRVVDKRVGAQSKQQIISWIEMLANLPV